MHDPALAPGYCKVCGEETHEILAIRSLDSEQLPGWPASIGKRLAGVRKIHLKLVNGSWADVVVHLSCVPVDAKELVALWGKVLAATAFEADHYWALKGVERPNGEKSDQIEAAVQRSAVMIASLCPLDVVRRDG